ncbi:thioredoxin [Acidihalobacter yilgarnensis]|uniref:Thioredoxin n=1 Tax=Acidihalobacter yilgarnensis TaxID=2819280 RepID=A0A1D8IL26_9GAMM|nr:thioredoxin domain-containing protein [Acidihalobacter yilgarnensis]AOU97170.1 thioredoxin [Acidihalobacter yilgarnensis]
MMSSATPNRLAEETSPYLLQHADNPVDWYPWGEAALCRSRSEDKPILLSIGYSACHWCHVMAHESFEDPAIAAIMNAHFVNVKVDREERPDIDRIYQTAHHLLTQRGGGWPLTLFLTPDQVPFFAGTYFPKSAHYGLPGFPELLQRLAEIYRERRDDIDQQNAELLGMLAQLGNRALAETPLNAMAIDRARAELSRHYDPTWGGFEAAPKFPHTASLTRLLRHWSSARLDGRDDEQALGMALHTLERMAEGGIFDHLGGGFARYSVDERWMIPHFEKMLYDNGPLLALYAQAHAATGRTDFRTVAEETAAWVMREMQAPEGGYYSSLDADSEGEEGRFYAWTRETVRDTVGEAGYPLFAARYGLDGPANFEGRWHLVGARPLAEAAAAAGFDEAAATARLTAAREHLFALRETRIRPGLDDKILTAWNALMIRGMAIAARHLNRPGYAQSAERALSFIREVLWRDGRLLATCKDGHAHLPAYLDDYAFLIDALLELLQLRWRSDEADFARTLADTLLAHFEDGEHGGFYFTADDHENLIQRPKPMADEAMPSGYGVATRALIRLGHLLGEPRYLEAADRALAAASGAIDQAPSAHCSLLDALEEQLNPTSLVILRGPSEALAPWLARSLTPFAPSRLAFAIPADADDLPAALADKPSGTTPRAYYCHGAHCAPVIDRLESLNAALREDEPAADDAAKPT